jgi:DNA replication protein DnaC
MMQDNLPILEKGLQELCLSAMRTHYQALARQAAAESWSYTLYLLEMVQQECQQRRQKRIQRWLKDSKLPLEKNWQTLDLKRLPLKVAQQLRGLLSGDFLDRHENVLLFGPPGSGKTHALCAVSQELLRSGRRLLFTKGGLLVQELLAAKRDLRLPAVLKRLAQWEGLLIDDLGYVQQSREEMEVLFTLLAERYERGSVLVTSNLPFSKWEQIFKDPMTAAAAIDRMVHHSVIVEMNVTSYRMEKAKKHKGANEVPASEASGSVG